MHICMKYKIPRVMYVHVYVYIIIASKTTSKMDVFIVHEQCSKFSVLLSVSLLYTAIHIHAHVV